MHALTAWDLKFQVCKGHTFTPATLYKIAKLTADNFELRLAKSKEIHSLML
jgi:hypothetical protein